MHWTRCAPRRSGRRARSWWASASPDGGADRALAEAAVDQHAEGDRAVAHLVFLGRVHLAEGDVVTGRHEDRVVAEAAAAAWRIGERAEDLAFEDVAMV